MTLALMEDDVNPNNCDPSRPAAGYVDGLYRWDDGAWVRFPKGTIPITVFGRPNVRSADCEQGDLTPKQLARWLRDELDASRRSMPYCNSGQWAECLAEAAALGIAEDQEDWWIAHYDGVEILPPGAAAKQHLSFADKDISLINVEAVFPGAVSLAPPPPPPPVITPGGTTLNGHITAISALSDGYWLAGVDGGVFAFGHPFDGSEGGQPLNKPVVSIAATLDIGGYWLAAADGGVFAFGDATFYGSMGGAPLNAPVMSITAAPDGKGYWLAAADGGVFAYGSAPFRGSAGGRPLNAPVVELIARPQGDGYWLIALDGGVFSYGAGFHGSMGGQHLNAPVVGGAATPSGLGYWLVASDGGIFTFGDAGFFGSAADPAHPHAYPVVGMAGARDGQGYALVTANGQVLTFGSAVNKGQL